MAPPQNLANIKGPKACRHSGKFLTLEVTQKLKAFRQSNFKVESAYPSLTQLLLTEQKERLINQSNSVPKGQDLQRILNRSAPSHVSFRPMKIGPELCSRASVSQTLASQCIHRSILWVKVTAIIYQQIMYIVKSIWHLIHISYLRQLKTTWTTSVDRFVSAKPVSLQQPYKRPS